LSAAQDKAGVDDVSFGSSYEFDDALAMSDTANALVASYDPTTSSLYGRKQQSSQAAQKSSGNNLDEARHKDIRTDVFSYLQNKHDGQDSPGSDSSPGNRFGSTIGRSDRGDEDDVLFGTAALSGRGFGDTDSMGNSKGLSFGASTYDDNLDLSTSKEGDDDVDALIQQSLNKPLSAVIPSGQASSRVWNDGRAPLELVETGHALDVLVSALRLDSACGSSNVRLRVDFLGAQSAPSSAVAVGPRATVERVDYSAHIVFNRAVSVLLSKQLSAQGDNFSLLISVVDASSGKLLGSATVLLYVMIEDSCSILRQEVDILSADGEDILLGVAVIDVRGHQVLQNI